MGVYFNDYANNVSKQGTITYAGLAPGLLGYQLNVTIPTGIGPSTDPGVYLEIVTDQADINQVQISVGGSSVAGLRPQARPTGLQPRRHPSALKRSGSAQPSRRSSVE
jgi:hypothetical protein